MAAPSVTNTFTNGTTADATEINTNFSDLITSLSSTNDDITVGTLTVGGAATFNGACTLGNSSGDDITITGYIAADVDPKTASTFDLGDSTQLWKGIYGMDSFMSLGATGTPSHTFYSDQDTGMWSSGSDVLNFSTSGTERLELAAAEAVFNDGGADTNFRIESDNDPYIFFVDAGNDKVLMGANSDLVITGNIGGVASEVQINNGSNTAGLAIVRNDAGAFGTSLVLAKGSASAIVSDGDVVGTIRWGAHDGVDWNNQCATISANIDGTPGANDTPGELLFATTADGANSATTRMVIRSDGKIGIAMTTLAHILDVTGTAGLSTGTAWTNTSDERLKDLEGDFTYGLAEIEQINPIWFKWKKDNPLELVSEERRTGAIAQDIQKIIPEAVSVRDDKRGDGDYLELNVDPIHWASINAIKELSARIVALEAKLSLTS